MNARRSPGRLAELASATARPHESPACCELCATELGPKHRHLLELESDALRCACPACALLFDRREPSGESGYRLIPDRRLYVCDFELDDATWARWDVPVGLAFFVPRAPAAAVRALLPGPAGATASEVAPEAWSEVVQANPVLETLEPHVEALLVRRIRGAREHWIVPLDEAFALAGRVRGTWKGLGGGEETHDAIETFFERLRGKARVVARSGIRLGM